MFPKLAKTLKNCRLVNFFSLILIFFASNLQCDVPCCATMSLYLEDPNTFWNRLTSNVSTGGAAATREGDGVVAGGEAAEDPGGDVQDTLTATCTQCFRMSRSQ